MSARPNSRKKRKARWRAVLREVEKLIFVSSFPGTPLHFAAAHEILRRQRHE